MKVVDLLVITLTLCLFGCATKDPEVIYKTEYVVTKVPVVLELQRPKRPIYTSKDTVPGYLLKLRQYTVTLEMIIDEANKRSGK